MPVYGEFTDIVDSRTLQHINTRFIKAASPTDYPHLLRIASCDRHGNWKPARFTVEQVRELRDCLDRFLADQTTTL